MDESAIHIRRIISIGFLSWLAVLGIDFFLHAGLFADLYTQPTPSLLAPEDAFRLIPLGYLALLFQIILLIWLMVHLKIQNWKDGSIFGGKLGILLGSSLVLGMLSIQPCHGNFCWLPCLPRSWNWSSLVQSSDLAYTLRNYAPSWLG